LISFLETCKIGQAVFAGLHPVNGHLQMLTGAMVDALQSIDEVRHVVGRTLVLAWWNPEQ
jgi:hypothetical protein